MRVIWMSVAGDLEPLRELNGAVEAGLEALGFARERRAFRPHITLGRVRDGAPVPQRRAVADALAAVEFDSRPDAARRERLIHTQRTDAVRLGVHAAAHRAVGGLRRKVPYGVGGLVRAQRAVEESLRLWSQTLVRTSIVDSLQLKILSQPALVEVDVQDAGSVEPVLAVSSLCVSFARTARHV